MLPTIHTRITFITYIKKSCFIDRDAEQVLLIRIKAAYPGRAFNISVAFCKFHCVCGMRLLLREGIGYSKLSHFLAFVYVDLIVCFLDLISFRAMYTFVVFNEFFPVSMNGKSTMSTPNMMLFGWVAAKVESLYQVLPYLDFLRLSELRFNCCLI